MNDIHPLFVPPAPTPGLLDASPTPDDLIVQATQDEIMVITVEAMKKLAFEEYAANEHIEQVCKVEDMSTVGRTPEGVVGAELEIQEAPAIIDEWELAVAESEKHFDLLHGEGTGTEGDEDDDEDEQRDECDMEWRSSQDTQSAPAAVPGLDHRANSTEDVAFAGASIAGLTAAFALSTRRADGWRDAAKRAGEPAEQIDGEASTYDAQVDQVDQGAPGDSLAPQVDETATPGSDDPMSIEAARPAAGWQDAQSGLDGPAAGRAEHAPADLPATVDEWEWAAAEAETPLDLLQNDGTGTEGGGDQDGDDNEQEQREVDRRSAPGDTDAPSEGSSGPGLAPDDAALPLAGAAIAALAVKRARPTRLGHWWRDDFIGWDSAAEEAEQKYRVSPSQARTDARGGDDRGRQPGQDTGMRSLQDACDAASERARLEQLALTDQQAWSGVAIAAAAAGGTPSSGASARWRDDAGGWGGAGKPGQDKGNDKAPAPQAGKAASLGQPGVSGLPVRKPLLKGRRNWSLRRVKRIRRG